MTTYQFSKSNANFGKLHKEVSALNLTGFLGVRGDSSTVQVDFSVSLSEAEQGVLLGAITAHTGALSPQEQVAITLKNAQNFGSQLLQEFTIENILLGITQAGMTNQVRKVCANVVSALQTGSLYDAIYEAKHIPPEGKDVTFITDARLLAFVNKIETYLGIALSTTL